MRCVLGLFEGVVTGAADGYYRMADRPAATLLHLGPGLANGLANLHNAKKARSGIVNIVGEHATLPPGARCAVDLRRRRRGAADVGLGADLGIVARRSPPTAHWPSQAARTAAGPDRHADPAGRYRLERGRRRAMCACRSATLWRCGAASVRAAAQALRAAGPSALLLGGAGVRERCAAAGRTHRREDRLRRAQRVQQPAPAARRRQGGDAARALCGRQRAGSC